LDETDKPHFQTLKIVYQNQAILRLVSKNLAPQNAHRVKRPDALLRSA